MKVAVIGSNSFSGSHFVWHLLNETDYQVLGISRSPEKSGLFLPYKRSQHLDRYRFVQADLNHDQTKIQGVLQESQPEYIVNFAAQSEVAPSWKHPEHWMMTNGVAVAALGNFLKDQKWLQRYVHISSPEVYGSCEGVVKEDAPANPSTPYAASKAAGDLMLSTLVKNFDFPLVTIRATNVYGPHQQLFKIIPRSVIYLKSGRTIQLHGGGVAVKSYIHIEDVSRGELSAMEQGRPGDIYHLSPKQGTEVRQVVRKICELAGHDFHSAVEMVEERLGQDKAYVIDSTKATTELGWQPRIDLETGLRQVVDWVEEWWEEIQKSPTEYIHKA